ncbi:hypothetical protein AK88_00151 [Plasmodium fragile]|uniref:Uncharacterized protein n=1 Tax=Plasmodium fragile TaxID=5857 RepID=A0A0D9QTK2_PLAFR|nr:uncharacterized protein AK88_00151 [Plasmodium fragile]KJP90303.1 hypothetical protein AK88_00151 [Plasmodium fragile]
MGDYRRKIPIYNDYEKKKDLLKFSFLKDGEEEQRDVQKKHTTEEVQFISKYHKRARRVEERLTKRCKKQGTRKYPFCFFYTLFANKLKEDNSESYYAHEKKFPFLIDTTVKKPDITRSMQDVLNNIYEQDDAEKIRLSEDIKTKEVLLERRKKLFLQELGGGEMVDVHAELFLDPQKDYGDAVKNKNKMLTLKNYGLGQSPSDFVFSYPQVKANHKQNEGKKNAYTWADDVYGPMHYISSSAFTWNATLFYFIFCVVTQKTEGRGGYASEMVKSHIRKNKYEGITKRLNVHNVEDLYTGKNQEMREQAGSHGGNITTKSIFLMKNRLRYINHTRNSHFVESYLKERPRIILRYKGFQKRL